MKPLITKADPGIINYIRIPTFLPQVEETKHSLGWGIRNIFAGGQLAKAEAVIKAAQEQYERDILDTTRPGLSTSDFAPQFVSRGWMGLPYFYENGVSILSDVIRKRGMECMRNRTSWEPKFVVKCRECDKEFQNKVEECDKCHSKDLREPDNLELDWLVRVDGTNFMDKANGNGQSWVSVTRTYLRHVDTADNPYMLCIYAYIFKDGYLMYKLPKEFMALDSRDVSILFNSVGEIGKTGRICLEHRDILITLTDYAENGIINEEKVPQQCPLCGKQLFPAAYQTTTMSGPNRYYTFDEIYHEPFWEPGYLYGTSPILKIVDLLEAYRQLEKRTRSYYEIARSPGILFLPMSNQAALKASWLTMKEQIAQDPYAPPVFGTSETAPVQANYIKLAEDPNQNLIAVKNELRERLCSAYMVSVTFTNDTQGGNVDSNNLVTVTDRGIEALQKYLNEGLFRWFARCFGIADYELKCNPHIGANETADEQLFALRIQNARGMMEMGFDVKYTDRNFEYSGEPMNLMQMNMMQNGGMDGSGFVGEMEQQIEGMLGNSTSTINGQADNPIDGTAPPRMGEPQPPTPPQVAQQATGQRTLQSLFG